ncbi:MAG: hypothetical protein ACRCZ2_04740 [Fusobacteriaceae bacterium]
MKKLLLIIAITSLTACSSLNQINTEHRAEKEALRSAYREQIRPIEENYKADNKKLKTKHSIEFGAYVIKKANLLKEFMK